MNLLGYGAVALAVLVAALVLAAARRRRPPDLPDPLVRALLDELGDQVAVFDLGLRVVRANASWVAQGREAPGTSLVSRLGAGHPVRRALDACLGSRQRVGSLVCRWGHQNVVLGLTPLVDAFGDLLGGVVVLAPAHDFEARVREAGLTERETELVLGIVAGQTYKQIAEALGLGEATVKTHLQNVFRKTGCRSRHEVAAWCSAPGSDVTAS